MNARQDPFADDPWLAAKPRRVWRTPKWLVVSLVGCAGSIVVGFVGLIAFGVAIETGHLPDSKALSKKELSAATLAWLRENGLVEPGESVEYFYADGLLEFREGGCFVTDRRVVNFFPGEMEEEWDLFAAPLRDVIRIETTFNEDWVGSSSIEIETADFRYTTLSINNEEKGDRSFDRTLRTLWRAHRSRARAEASADGRVGLDRQLEVLARFGIELRPECERSGLLQQFDRTRYEEEPFDVLIHSLAAHETACGGEPPSHDVWLLEHECIEDRGDYARILVRLRALSDGTLDIEAIEDDLDFEQRVGTVSFRHRGETESWDAEINENRIDETILARADDLLAEGGSGRRFASAWLEEEDRSIVVCIDEKRLVELRNLTGMPFDFLGPFEE